MKLWIKLIGALAGLALLAVVGALAAFWQPDIPVEELKGRYAPPPSQFVSISGLAVHLRDEGPRTDPEPIILIHGTSSSLHTFEGWAQELKKTRRVVRFDTLGFGLTGPSAQGDYSIPAYVRQVLAVMDHLNIAKAMIAGNSLGGEIAWGVAVAQPARVTRLGLIDAGGYPFTPESVPLGFRIARTPLLRDLMQVTLPRSIVESSIKNVMGDPSKVTPELVSRYYDLTARAGNRRAVGQRFAQMRTDNSAAIKTIKQPTLILWGGKDRLIPPRYGLDFKRDIAGSEHVQFDDLGHVPHEEDAPRTLAVFTAFLAKPAP
jgi:pimeloyl-ACP methyl ester carboxylesterase